MKKVITVGLGGRDFAMDDDAYAGLSKYLDAFRGMLDKGSDECDEIMNELESRLAELIGKEIEGNRNVVSLDIIEKVTRGVGMPDGSTAFVNDDSKTQSNQSAGNQYADNYFDRPVHRFYLDTDNRFIGGVCAGIAAYFNIDLVLVRLLVLLLFLFGGIGLLPYLIVWLVVPKAVTLAQKCELRGIPATAENMAKMSKRL